MSNQEIIVAAAIRVSNLTISMKRPARYHNLYHSIGRFIPNIEIDEEGFITSDGRFVSRDEAGVLARRSGQLNAPIKGDLLASEDLWDGSVWDCCPNCVTAKIRRDENIRNRD